MQIINGTNVAGRCDYSFGDHMALWDKSLFEGEFKVANATNQEFLNKAREFEGRIMTLFIDNIRLYSRPVRVDTKVDLEVVNYLMQTNHLLLLCRLLPDNKFIIFTGQEDTPIDEDIQLPDNVIRLHAVNAIYNNERIIPLPFGVQRKMFLLDNRIDILKDNVENYEHIEPTKLLYINCSIERSHDRDYLPNFSGLDWCTTHFDKSSKYFPYSRYQEFLDTIKSHKFMLCPKGHFDTMDCHRIWESLYMRRVPVFRHNPYYDKLMKGFPVLFVNEWSDITPELLKANDHLYQEAQKMDLSTLDLDVIFPLLSK